MEEKPQSWVALRVLEVVGERALVDRYLEDALDFVRTVSDAAAAHLRLLLQNTFRTPWLAAKMLSTDAFHARASAREVLKHLDTTLPANRSSFEKHLLGSPELWLNLQAFAVEDPPVLLWRGRGRFECLFKFLGPRFLLAPDHVLDAERIHARWQWSCIVKRNIRFQALNASLRLTHYREQHRDFPSHEALLPYLHAELLEHRIAKEALYDEDEVALGHRSSHRQGSWPANLWSSINFGDGGDYGWWAGWWGWWWWWW